MTSILGGIVVAIVIGIGVGYVLKVDNRLAYEAYTSDVSARVGDPGANLVGPKWTGEGGVKRDEGT